MKNDRVGKSPGSKLGIGCGIVLLAFGLTVMIRWVEGTSTPSLVVPAKPAAPSPNAFDTFRNAAQLLVNTKQINDSTSPRSAVTDAERASLVASNAQALQMLRTGFSQDYYDTTSRSIFALYPYYAQFRVMCRLLDLEARLRADRGDWNGAMQSELDCVRLGVVMPRGGPIIGELVGVACQAIGRHKMWSYLEHLDAQQSRAAIKQLLAIGKLRVPYYDTMTEERYMSLSALKIMFKDPHGIGAALGSPNGGPPVAVSQLMYLVYSKNTIAMNNQKYMDALIEHAHQPYGLHLPEPPPPSDPVNKILTPAFSQARLKYVESETQYDLILMAIALHAYKLEHGAYPKELTALTPSLLPGLPDDPFAVKGNFQYRPSEGGKYVLYSIGPDGIDDGGKPIDDPAKSAGTSSNGRYFVESSSKGDVVAGTNLW